MTVKQLIKKGMNPTSIQSRELYWDWSQENIPEYFMGMEVIRIIGRMFFV